MAPHLTPAELDFIQEKERLGKDVLDIHAAPQPHGSHAVATQQPHSSHTVATQLPHSYHTVATWESLVIPRNAYKEMTYIF